MNPTTVQEMQCVHCKTWFTSPIQMPDAATFAGANVADNEMNCSNCGEMTPCNKENMRWRLLDGRGGFVGGDVR